MTDKSAVEKLADEWGHVLLTSYYLPAPAAQAQLRAAIEADRKALDALDEMDEGEA